MRDVIVLEMNEINGEVLSTMMADGRLPQFRELLKTHAVIETQADESYENLEPWIQWVTVHTGLAQSEHRAFNLTDGQHLNLVRVWDTLETQGIGCGVVSPMNSQRGGIERGFYIPDPWSAANDTFPPKLAPIYRFLSERVNTHNAGLDGASSPLRFVIESMRAGVALPVVRLAVQYLRAKLVKKSKWKLAAAFDRYIVELALALRRRFGTRYTSVFLNGVAHYQHHYWSCHNAKHWAQRYPKVFTLRNPLVERNLRDDDDPIAYGMQAYDRIVGRVRRACPNSEIVIVTGLSQVPFQGYAGGRGYYLYRAYDHAAFLQRIGVRYRRAAPLMSRDLMIYFDSEEQRANAVRIFERTNIGGERLLDWTLEKDRRLFVKVGFSFAVEEGAAITTPMLPEGLPFAAWFQFVTFKTGHHDPRGLVVVPQRFASGRDGAPMPLAHVRHLLLEIVGARVEARGLNTIAAAGAA